MDIVPALSTLVAFAFAYAVFRRYQRKGGPHLIHWSFGLLLYGLGTLSEVLLGLAFNGWVLKLWYLCGAMLTAAWLGQGTMHLLVRKGNIAQYLTYALGLVSAVAVAMVALAPLTAAQASYHIAQPVSAQYKDILTRNGLIIFLTIILNIYGTLGLVGGALYSAFLFWRKKILASRMYGNILIAIGALSPALAGTFVKTGLVDVLYFSEFVGAVLMFIGFTLATANKEVKESKAEAQAA